MRGFQKGITLGGRTFGMFYNVGLQNWVAKKICKIFASEFRFKSGVMRGFQKGITLDGRTSGSLHIVGLQNWVAKKFANFLHLSWDLSLGS